MTNVTFLHVASIACTLTQHQTVLSTCCSCASIKHLYLYLQSYYPLQLLRKSDHVYLSYQNILSCSLSTMFLHVNFHHAFSLCPNICEMNIYLIIIILSLLTIAAADHCYDMNVITYHCFYHLYCILLSKLIPYHNSIRSHNINYFCLN